MSVGAQLKKPFKPSPWVKLRTAKQLQKAEDEKPRLVDRFVKVSLVKR